jgi:hypothetical protein
VAAWSTIVLVVVFISITCWWLSQDRSIPVYDAGAHLGFAFDAFDALSSGHLLKALTESVPYPPFAYLVGSLGVFVGGIAVAPPIIASNLIFVPLLALGCYKVARLAFGPTAGPLAVVFALGSPMVIEEFHEFMLDAPEAAMVAVAVWAILASERFSRPRVSALAGLAVGLGMLTKETFVFFVAGVALVSVIRGGRRAWRGVAVFAVVVVVIALPWYLYEFNIIHVLEGEALGSSSHLSSLKIPPGLAPPRLSRANLEWYFWSFVNWQLYLPLFAFSAVGGIWAMVGFARRRPVSGVAVELVFGALISWAALTETYVHDPRYGIPMMLYFAVFGVGWVVRLPRRALAVAATALAVVALANTLGVTFGVGTPVTTRPGNPTYVQQPGMFTLYSNYGYWVGPPARDGEMLGVLRALRRNGVREVWISVQESSIEYSYPGMVVLARIAGLGVLSRDLDPASASPRDAFLSRVEPERGVPRPCVTLRDGTGVWVRIGGSRELGAWSYCPRGIA